MLKLVARHWLELKLADVDPSWTCRHPWLLYWRVSCRYGEFWGYLCWHLEIGILPFLVHQVHRNEEHGFREITVSLWIRQVPDLRTHTFIKLCLHHDLLHFFVSERATAIFVEHIHHICISLFILR